MINNRVLCRYCWRHHDTAVRSFAGHAICPEAGEASHHGQPRLYCYECGGPPNAGHTGPSRKPACRAHRLPDDAVNEWTFRTGTVPARVDQYPSAQNGG
jgi:hypothetical protein